MRRRLLGWVVIVGCLLSASQAAAVSIGSPSIGVPPASSIAASPNWLNGLFGVPSVSWRDQVEPGWGGSFFRQLNPNADWEALIEFTNTIFSTLFGSGFDFPLPSASSDLEAPATAGSVELGGSAGIVVPEPTSAALVCLGLAVLATGRRWRHSA